MVRYENVRVADSKESQSNRALNKIFSCYSRQRNAMTHIPRNLPHYNLQQGFKCSASFRWGVGFGYRLKSAPFLRDHIRHDQLYAAVARPVTCVRQIRRCNIRWCGVLMLSEVEQRLRIADRFAGFIEDQRAPDQITHALADIIRFRLLMIAAGYEDGNDANGLRVDPI